MRVKDYITAAENHPEHTVNETKKTQLNNRWDFSLCALPASPDWLKTRPWVSKVSPSFTPMPSIDKGTEEIENQAVNHTYFLV